MVVTGAEIPTFFEEDTYVPGSLQSNSYDVTVGTKAVKGGMGSYEDLSAPDAVLELEPGNLAFVISQEKVKLPTDVCATIGSKRKLSYMGILLLSGEFVDPGYRGHLLFALYNLSPDPFPIRKGAKIANITFERVSWGETDEPEINSDEHLLKGDFPPEIFHSTARLKPVGAGAVKDQLDRLRAEVEQLRRDYGNTTNLIRDLGNQVKGTLEGVKEQGASIDRLREIVDSQQKRLQEHEGELEQLRRLAFGFEPIVKDWPGFSRNIKVITAIASVVLGAIVVGVVVHLLRLWGR